MELTAARIVFTLSMTRVLISGAKPPAAAAGLVSLDLVQGVSFITRWQTPLRIFAALLLLFGGAKITWDFITSFHYFDLYADQSRYYKRPSILDLFPWFALQIEQFDRCSASH